MGWVPLFHGPSLESRYHDQQLSPIIRDMRQSYWPGQLALLVQLVGRNKRSVGIGSFREWTILKRSLGLDSE